MAILSLPSLQLRRRAQLDLPARDALAAVLTTPKVELVPLKHALDQAAFLPPGALVSVTASPARGWTRRSRSAPSSGRGATSWYPTCRRT